MPRLSSRPGCLGITASAKRWLSSARIKIVCIVRLMTRFVEVEANRGDQRGVQPDGKEQQSQRSDANLARVAAWWFLLRREGDPPG